MEDAGERREEVVELVVLLRERPLNTDSRLGLCACAVDLERVWTEYGSGDSLWGALAEGRSRSCWDMVWVDAGRWEACIKGTEGRIVDYISDSPVGDDRVGG